MSKVIPRGERLEERWENRNDQGRDKEEITQKYFEILSTDEVDKLFNLYKVDFQMFRYVWQFRGKEYS